MKKRQLDYETFVRELFHQAVERKLASEPK